MKTLALAAGLALAASAAPRPATEGTLYRLNAKGEPVDICPLKHTNVNARITGPLARVDVTQEFTNPSTTPIEAVYKVPLPQHSAVDNLRMISGDRTVVAKIKSREDARQIFEAARAAGHTAALLDQERPNIFTQSVTNIPPGAAVKIVISYVETVPYDDGAYTFTFPMVVGPRYIPKDWPNRVPDAPNVVPRRTPEGTRAGHDIDIQVSLDAGVPLNAIASPTHAVDIARTGTHQAAAKLRDAATIPNKDFILTYTVAGRKIEDAILAHNSGAAGGYFTFLLQPPARVAPGEITPKEIVFVLDTSGSMMGFPIEKAKEAMKLAMDSLNPRDTFNLITFAGDTHVLFPRPVPATPENLRQAQSFLLSRQGRGGTEMMKAIRAALDPSNQQSHIRIVCFMTDAEVGHDMEIISEIQKHPNARVFAFGIGSSVNRFLLDGMARYGRGEVEYVGLNDDGSAAARRFHERVHTPVLTDISIDWAGLPVSEIYPKRIPDLFSAKPVVLTGRYSGAARGNIRLRGKLAGRELERTIWVDLPGSEPNNNSIATLWARSKVEDLMSQDWLGIQRGVPRNDLRDQIKQLGLDYRLITQYTSFVAVEETTIIDGGKPRRIEVPVEMPEGVSYEGVYGREADVRKSAILAAPTFAMQAPASLVRSRDRHQEVVSNRPPGKISPKLQGKTGPILVQLWLKDQSQPALAKLKALGVEVLNRPRSARLIIARVDAAKLPALAQLTEVTFISPV